MFARICPVCKNNFFSENKYFEDDLAWHNSCFLRKKIEEKKQRPVRTSTPVSDPEHSTSPSFSDSVTDFFYQSWKSGLHSDETSSVKVFNQRNQHTPAMPQPVCFPPQVVYVNTVIFQPYMPISYIQYVGYRPDGTFGILPNYWSYDANSLH